MRVNDTVIKWHVVNMRVKENDLPDEHTQIVYFNNGIYSSYALKDGKCNLCVNLDFGSKQIIKTGFIWCYQKDIPIPQECE